MPILPWYKNARHLSTSSLMISAMPDCGGYGTWDMAHIPDPSANPSAPGTINREIARGVMHAVSGGDRGVSWWGAQ